MSNAVPAPRIAAVPSPSRVTIVTSVVSRAAAEARSLDVGELFWVQVEGVSTVSNSLMEDIAARASLSGIRLNYVVGTRCYFIVHEKGR